jgi:hypothetical protein
MAQPGSSDLGARHRPRRWALGGILLLLAGCGSTSHTSASTTIPANLSNFEAVVKGSTSGSGVTQLSPSLAESVGNGICEQLSQGETPGQISDAALSQATGDFPPKAFAELMVDASQWLCPKYAAEVKQFAQS